MSARFWNSERDFRRLDSVSTIEIPNILENGAVDYEHDTVGFARDRLLQGGMGSLY
jgi:hypothetical protein